MTSPLYKRQRISPRVRRTDYFWGFQLDGTQGALIASGLADADWFSDRAERDVRGNTIRLKHLHLYGRNIETFRPAQGLCSVSVYRRTDEEDQRDDPSAWRDFVRARSVQDTAFHQFLQRALTKPKHGPRT